MKIDDILNLQNEEEIILKIGESIWKKTQYDYDNFSNLNEIERTFIYVDILEGQVNNGGFDQFFFNSSGDYTYEVLEAYENIGAYKTANLISEAINAFPKLPVSKDTETRRITMQDLSEEISEKWNQLDDKFYEYEENIMNYLIEYIKKNKEMI
ncbi:hypothetical protein FSS13T_18560 [Flavobacterium saliperosum S13]|uniref:DNA mimic protein DMP19 C-terminal domain-containing protein n=2 Tax=Flavobacterium saliperosum TaxID=329186 RepID=A0A1G4W9I2_9FLAO|nr:DMP19 family protein [Flavobacterium saliperosum]ESU25214.1 hypothetical protein FSS13T_18560 [Flavobacterium saliperosum S13]SCX19016.1 protein of unknown function [Flavobacterium saliperosum]